MKSLQAHIQENLQINESEAKLKSILDSFVSKINDKNYQATRYKETDLKKLYTLSVKPHKFADFEIIATGSNKKSYQVAEITFHDGQIICLLDGYSEQGSLKSVPKGLISDIVKLFNLKHTDKSQSDDDLYGTLPSNVKILESVNEASEITSDEQFIEYGEKMLKAAHGEDYDKEKADDTLKGILKDADGDYGQAVGTLQSSMD